MNGKGLSLDEIIRFAKKVMCPIAFDKQTAIDLMCSIVDEGIDHFVYYGNGYYFYYIRYIDQIDIIGLFLSDYIDYLKTFNPEKMDDEHDRFVITSVAFNDIMDSNDKPDRELIEHKFGF